MAAALLSSVLAACSADPAIDDSGRPDAASDGERSPRCGFEGAAEPPIAAPAIHTPRWAFEPWISKDISSSKDTYAFVGGFEKRDIPVGAVVLDSPWETHYNTFVPNPKRYPGFDRLVRDLRAKQVRVVLWITQMVNRTAIDLEKGGDSYSGPSPNFAEGRACGFFIEKGQTWAWWKGLGAAVDFFNGRARAWWHRQQDRVLDAGIAGWKLDFGDSYVGGRELLTAKGKVSHQAYSEAYYRDFFAYGVKKRGADFVTMVRGWDESYQFEGRFFARKEHAPVVWAGDNRRDWIGLADALHTMFRSAAAGYVVVGSDIGGYLDQDDQDASDKIPFDQDNFVRWTAVGALSPFMQLHGRANLAPWTVPARSTETVRIYRYWAWLHHELVPFWYSLAEQAYAGGDNLLRPIGPAASWPRDYRYQLGDALLVAPLLDSSGKRDVKLPAGARWYDWWKPADPPLSGGQKLAAYDATDRQRIPLFVREGAIIPAAVENGVTGLGTAASKGKLTVLVYPGASKSRFSLHETDGKTTAIEAQRGAGTTTISLSRVRRSTLLRVRADTAPSKVTVGGQTATKHADRASFDAASSGWFSQSSDKRVWVELAPSSARVTVELQ